MELARLSALVRAVARLHPTGGVDTALVEALGHLVAPGRADDGLAARRQAPVAPSLAPPAAGPALTGMVDAGDATRAGQPQPGVAPQAVARRRAQEGATRLTAMRSELERVSEQADLLPTQLRTAAAAGADRPEEPARRGLLPPVEALFPPGRVRAVLREMATVPVPSASPDLAAAVALIASGRPIRALPARPASALPHSILWLFEAGPSMLPYSRDRQQLARTVVRLLGEHRVRIGDFIADPVKGVRPRGQTRWRPLRWPGRDCALVLVSDLGTGSDRPAAAGAETAWHALLDEAGRRGVGTVLLNPYAPDRWPPVAAAFDVALTWDAGTGVQALRRTRRAARPH